VVPLDVGHHALHVDCAPETCRSARLDGYILHDVLDVWSAAGATSYFIENVLDYAGPLDAGQQLHQQQDYPESVHVWLNIRSLCSINIMFSLDCEPLPTVVGPFTFISFLYHELVIISIFTCSYCLVYVYLTLYKIHILFLLHFLFVINSSQFCELMQLVMGDTSTSD